MKFDVYNMLESGSLLLKVQIFSNICNYKGLGKTESLPLCSRIAFIPANRYSAHWLIVQAVNSQTQRPSG